MAKALDAGRSSATDPGTSVPPTASGPGAPSAPTIPVGSTDRHNRTRGPTGASAAIIISTPTAVRIFGPAVEIFTGSGLYAMRLRVPGVRGAAGWPVGSRCGQVSGSVVAGLRQTGNHLRGV